MEHRVNGANWLWCLEGAVGVIEAMLVMKNGRTC